MKDHTFTRKPNALRAIIAGLGFAAASTAFADTPTSVDLDFEMQCTFPLVGATPVHVTGTADVPEKTEAGSILSAVNIDFQGNLSAQTVGGLNVVKLGYLSGKAEVDITVEDVFEDVPVFLDIPLDKSAIPNQAIAAPVVTGSAVAPQLAFFDPGSVNVWINGITTKIEGFERDGSPVKGAFGLFEDKCTMDRYLVRTMQVVEGAGAAASLSSYSIDFGKVAPGTSANETVALKNIGTSPLTINDISSSSSSFITSNNCGTLSAGQSCDIEIQYTATSGTETGTVTVSTSGGDQSVSLVGYASQSGTLSTADSIGFAGLPAGESRDKEVSITNTGNASLTIQDIALSGDSDFVLVENDCSIIEVGESCSILLNFSPSSQGAKSADLRISSNDPINSNKVIAVSGSGKASEGGSFPENDIYIALEGEGLVQINTVSSGPAELRGTFDGTINRDTGAINFNMDLDRAQAKLVGLYILPLWINMDMLQTRPIVGTFSNSEMEFTAYLDVYLRMIAINFFGLKIPIAGGGNCKIISEREVPFKSVGKVNLAGGKTPINGPLYLGPVEKCGPLNVFVKAFVINLASSPIDLDLWFTDPAL